MALPLARPLRSLKSRDDAISRAFVSNRNVVTRNSRLRERGYANRDTPASCVQLKSLT